MDELLFARCAVVNELLAFGKEHEARDLLIQLLDYCEEQSIETLPLVNSLVRSVGLYPYLNPDVASWDERLLLSAFSADAGGTHPVVLHREQAGVLKRLIGGESLALSAPTSFGKSFVIDAFIALKRPKNVLIMVPTLALADETRRRLHTKFGSDYRVITATEEAPGTEGNIFIFPQERAISYSQKMPDLDLLIVDEFYKAGFEYDRDRSGALIRAILKFSERAKQRYFLAPNISALQENPFTKGMDFVRVEFNTVFLRKHELYQAIGKDSERKASVLVSILAAAKGKTLVYAGTYSGIAEVANILLESTPRTDRLLLEQFREWLVENYGSNWALPRLARRGIGVHNGQLHRSLSQLQVRLFEEQNGLQILLSTSSIIEGVNTSAQNVVLWRNKNGKSKLTDFEYKNIMGRSGRMFRHFIGEVYVLEEPPASVENQLKLDLPDSILGLQDVQSEATLSTEQRAKAERFNAELTGLLDGAGSVMEIAAENLQTSNSDLLKKMVFELKRHPENWAGLAYLNSSNPEDWTWSIYKVLELEGGVWDTGYKKFAAFIKIISRNWDLTIPELLEDLVEHDIDLDLFFKLERNLSYRFASLLGDVNVLHRILHKDRQFDISPFVFRVSNAFLPPLVFQLEEYGLPRMLSRKFHLAGIFDFSSTEFSLRECIGVLVGRRAEIVGGQLVQLSKFEKYVVEYFFSGVVAEPTRIEEQSNAE